MSAPKHTPEACRTCGGWGYVDNDETLCPYCHGTGDYPVEKHIRLERAAPRLVDALKHCVKVIEGLPEDALGYDGSEGWPYRDELAYHLRAALREAGIE